MQVGLTLTQVFLTILGGAIAGGVGLLIAFCQEKRKTKKDLKTVSDEIGRNIKLVHMYMEQVHKKDIAFFDTLQTTAFTIANSSGALTTLPEDKRKNIYYAYDQIILYQKREKGAKTGQAETFAEATEENLKRAREALKSTLNKSSWIFGRIL